MSLLPRTDWQMQAIEAESRLVDAEARALNAEALAREAGEALMYVHLPHPPVKVPCSACAILTKLRAAGLLKGGE